MAEAKVNKSEKARKTYLQNLIMMLVMAVSIILAVFAWFDNTKSANIDSVEVNSDANNSVQQRIIVNYPDSTSYDSGWQAESINLQEAIGTFEYAADISGNGLNYYRPQVDNQGNPVASEGAWVLDTTPVANQDYVVYDLYMRSTMQSNVYLTPSSYVIPETTTFDANVSLYQDYVTHLRIPKNYIAGAARVAFLKVTTVGGTDTETLRSIWVPNSAYELTSRTENPKFLTDFAFNTGGTAEAAYNYYNGSAVTALSSGSYFTTIKMPTVNTTDTPIFQINDAVNPDNNDGFSYVSHFRIKIWIEGTDREAHTALAGGNISTHFDFIAFADNN